NWLEVQRSFTSLRMTTQNGELEVSMAEEKTHGAGTATEDAPSENTMGKDTVQVTFLPEGKTVQFEHGKMPYEYHGKEESILDVALNCGVTLDHAWRQLRLHHL